MEWLHEPKSASIDEALLPSIWDNNDLVSDSFVCKESSFYIPEEDERTKGYEWKRIKC